MTADRPSLPWRVATRLRRSPSSYWAARRAFAAVNRLLPPVTLEGVPGPVHRNDLMVDRGSALSRRSYVTAAVQAVAMVRTSLEQVGGSLSSADVLDFGCGHGRIVRQLVEEARTVSACDLDHEAVRFCVRSFGATPIYGSPDLTAVPLASYDAIWLGSVITHHAPPICADLLRTLTRHLRPGGVLVLTSGDEMTLEDDQRAPSMSWLAPHVRRLRDDLRREGATHIPYPQNPSGSYGLGYQTAEWLDAVLTAEGLQRLWHRPRAWGAQAAHAWHHPPRGAPPR